MGSMSFAPAVVFDQTMEEAFPDVDSLHAATGSSIIVQIRSPKRKTAGGIMLPDDVQDTIRWNTQTAKVIDVGPVAFRNRTTLEPWPEKAWFKVGDFVRAPKYGGDRWEVAYKDEKGDTAYALFALVNDLDCKGVVRGDPRQVLAFV